MVRHPNRFHADLISQLRQLDHFLDGIESIKTQPDAHRSSPEAFTSFVKAK
jgi:hypothetical protein